MKKKNRPCTKVRHKTKEGACVAARKLKSCNINVYLCPKCKFWHIGNSRNPARRANRIDQLLQRHKRELEKRLKCSTTTTA